MFSYEIRRYVSKKVFLLIFHDQSFPFFIKFIIIIIVDTKVVPSFSSFYKIFIPFSSKNFFNTTLLQPSTSSFSLVRFILLFIFISSSLSILLISLNGDKSFLEQISDYHLCLLQRS
jgi:hypothetical protein